MTTEGLWTVRWGTATCLGLLLATSASAQARPGTDAFAAIAWLVGRWEGPSHGEPGQGRVTRTYERALGGRFVAVQNTSRWAPLPSHPTGEVHEDRGYIGFDRARRRFVYRQFHVEGFVNTYVADSVAAGDTVLRFVSEQIENIAPDGARGRPTPGRAPTASRSVSSSRRPGRSSSSIARPSCAGRGPGHRQLPRRGRGKGHP